MKQPNSKLEITCIDAHLSMTLSTCLLPSTPPLRNVFVKINLHRNKKGNEGLVQLKEVGTR